MYHIYQNSLSCVAIEPIFISLLIEYILFFLAYSTNQNKKGITGTKSLLLSNNLMALMIDSLHMIITDNYKIGKCFSE